MARHVLEPEELYRVGLESWARGGIDMSPEAQHLRPVARVIRTKQAYELLADRTGFGLLQLRPYRADTPMLEERFATKKVRVERYSAGYEAAIYDVENDPNGVIAKKGPLLQASVKHTMNAIMQAGLLRAAIAAASGGITSIIDQKPIYAVDHVVNGAPGNVQSNLLAEEITVEGIHNSLTAMHTQMNWQGQPVPDTPGWDYYVGPKEYDNVLQMLDSQLLPGTMNNDSNITLRRRIREVVLMKYWGLSTANDNVAIGVPNKAEDRPYIFVMLQDPRTRQEENSSRETVNTYCNMHLVFDGLNHHNTWMQAA